MFGYCLYCLAIFSILLQFSVLPQYLLFTELSGEVFERARISRAQAVIIVLLLTLTVFVILGVTLVPMVIDQTNQLLNKIPDWLNSSQDNLEQLQILAKRRRLPLNFSVINQQINTNIQILVQQIPSGAVGFAGTLLSGLLNVVLVIVLAFYMLLYGDRLWYGLVSLYHLISVYLSPHPYD